MKSFKVVFQDGNTLVTSMNATLDEAKKYYVGTSFNFGDTDWGVPDKTVKAISVKEVI